MKKYLITFYSLVIMLLVNCTGPVGPAGEQGLKGEPGVTIGKTYVIIKSVTTDQYPMIPTTTGSSSTDGFLFLAYNLNNVNIFAENDWIVTLSFAQNKNGPWMELSTYLSYVMTKEEKEAALLGTPMFENEYAVILDPTKKLLGSWYRFILIDPS